MKHVIFVYTLIPEPTTTTTSFYHQICYKGGAAADLNVVVFFSFKKIKFLPNFGFWQNQMLDRRWAVF